MPTRILVDITRAFPFTDLGELFASTRDFATLKQLSGNWTVFRRPDQPVPPEAFEPAAEVRTVESLPPSPAGWDCQPTAEAVANWIREKAADITPMTVVLLSFAREILLLSGGMTRNGGAPGVQFQAFSLGDVKRTSRVEAGWQWDAVAPIEQALNVVSQVLSFQGEMHITTLRPAMALLDQRFQGSGTSTGTQGMIGVLVEEGVRRGLWVIEGFGSSHKLKLASGPVPSPKPVVGEPGPKPAADHMGEMAQFLKERELGPFSRIRELAFRRFEDDFNDWGKTVLEFIDDTVECGVEEFKREFPSRGLPPVQPFRRFLYRVFDQTRTLLGEEGKALRVRLAASDQTVHGLAAGWRERIEALLFLPLAANFTMDDRALEDVARLLYLDDSGKGLGRLYRVIKHLKDQGSLTVDADQNIRVVEASDDGAEGTARS